MIEGEALVLPARYERGRRSVVSRLRRTREIIDQIGCAHGVPPRIALRIRIDADQAQSAGLDRRLFLQLAPGGRFDGLPDVDEPARQRVVPLEGFVPAADEK